MFLLSILAVASSHAPQRCAAVRGGLVRVGATRFRVRERVRERLLRPVSRRLHSLFFSSRPSPSTPQPIDITISTPLASTSPGDRPDILYTTEASLGNLGNIGDAPEMRVVDVEGDTEAALLPGEGKAGGGSPVALFDEICLEPGDPVVRIEDAPGNGVRIFTGIDIQSTMDEVWNILTDYENLHRVVPSLVSNEVLEKKEGGGARIYQIGAAKVLPGVNFKASMTLDVDVYTEDNPLPEEKIATHVDIDTSSEEVRAKGSRLPLKRGIFPRPFAETSLPKRDITMANVEGAPGDFDHYQGVWRVQPLETCAPDGEQYSRLTYAVEIKPKGLLPVGLIERRIAADLKVNLMAIRTVAEERAAATQPNN